MNKIIKIAAICLIVLVIIFGVFVLTLKQIYPKKHEAIIRTYSKEYNVDELLIYALIKAESNFREDSVSNKGAIGLMQLMEPTAIEIASNLDYQDFTIEELNDVNTNIKFGIKYFSDLLKEHNNNYLLALAAYNAGIGNVRRWIENGIIKEDGSDIENIPFKETNMYVRKILRDYDIYKKLY